MLEKELERKLTKAIRSRGGLCLKFVSPGTAGVPDRLILLPEGLAIFVELKRPNGRLRPLQRHVINELKSLGFEAFVISNEEELYQFLHVDIPRVVCDNKGDK